MANPRFPGPNIHKIIEPNTDSQFVTVPLDEMDIGGRKTSSRVEKGKNIGVIRHVKNEG